MRLGYSNHLVTTQRNNGKPVAASPGVGQGPRVDTPDALIHPEWDLHGQLVGERQETLSGVDGETQVCHWAESA